MRSIRKFELEGILSRKKNARDQYFWMAAEALAWRHGGVFDAVTDVPSIFYVSHISPHTIRKVAKNHLHLAAATIIANGPVEPTSSRIAAASAGAICTAHLFLAEPLDRLRPTALCASPSVPSTHVRAQHRIILYTLTLTTCSRFDSLPCAKMAAFETK